jgi:anti-sigma factor RsiW
MNPNMNTNMNMNTTSEPDDIETLLPWHAAGTLSPRDARRVEAALARDPELAKRYALVREELGEAIRLNERLGAPSTRAMDALFNKIDAEPARAPRVSLNLAQWASEFFASRSPRTLAWSATGAAVAILLQAGLLAGLVLNKEAAPGGYQTASAPAAAAVEGSFAVVRFAAHASSTDVTAFLQANSLTIAGGPLPGGLYRVRVSESKMPKEQLAERVKQLQQDRRIELIAAVE